MTAYPEQTRCPACNYMHSSTRCALCGAPSREYSAVLAMTKPRDDEHDCNVDMFGADAEYLEVAGLADKIGNK